MDETIRVLLVDDQSLIRIGFRLMLESEPDIAVVGEAADGAEALAQTAAQHPDVVLMDVRMPGMDGIAATEEIVRRHPEVRVLVLTTFDLDEYAFGAVRGRSAKETLDAARPPDSRFRTAANFSFSSSDAPFCFTCPAADTTTCGYNPKYSTPSDTAYVGVTNGTAK